MENRKEYIEKMTAKLYDWDAEIQQLEAKAKDAAGKVKTELDKQLKELNMEKDAAKQKLNAIQEASQDSWGDVKAVAELSFETLGDSINKVWSIIKK